ncbi:MAG: FHA domain-containing protein [Spirochaetota bacterium]
MSTSEWYLQGQLSDNSPWIVPIYKHGFTIGRGADRDLILSTAGVSRRHACLYREGEDLYIEDSGSRNGTYLNGGPVGRRTLVHHDDILQIGGYEFTIRYRERSEAADQTVVESQQSSKSGFARAYGLSEREQDVLYLLLRGKTVPEIGEKLYISPGTAKLHTQSIYKKTGCHSRMELLTLYRGPVS